MKLLKVVLPIAVLTIAGLGAWALLNAREKPETRPPEDVLPLVRVQTIEMQDLQLTVKSQGTVRPRTVSELTSEVSGRVIEVAATFVSGGFFEQGDVLLRIDPGDYRQAVALAESSVAQAETRVMWERAEAESARREWEEIGEGEAPALTLRQPQVAEVEASLSAAKAALDKARRDLERTEIRAPYAGRVRDKKADLGQFVSRGAPLGTIYAVDYAEIRLPLPDAELAFLNLPLTYRGERNGARYPSVKLRADFAGKEFVWSGRIVRTEGEIDPVSRMVQTVAQVQNPYGRGDDPERPPLAAGLFVHAEIEGREVANVTVIPRSTVRTGDQVLIVDDEDRLRFRDIQIIRGAGNEVVVGSGLQPGDRLCLSPLATVTDGMRVLVESVDPGAS